MKTEMRYFKDEDVIHVAFSREAEHGSVEISPDVTAELNARGEIIGIEILRASRFLRDTVLESAQGRLLALQPRKAPGRQTRTLHQTAHV